MEEQALLKLEHCTSDQADQLLDAYRELKAQTCAFVRIELCAECSLQLTFGVLLLTFSRSNTRTQTGLEAVFNDSKPLIFGIPPILLIIFNYIWNIFSAWRSFVKGMSSTKDHFPLKTSQFVLGFYVVLSLLINCSITLIFFAPSLGLFGLLAHYQGELLPYWAASELIAKKGLSKELIFLTAKELIAKRGLSLDTELVYYSDVEPFPWSQLTRFNYSDPDNPTRPALEDVYTFFSMETILVSFWALLGLQTLGIMVVKKLSNPKNFRKMNWLEIITHAFQNTQLVCPMQDWDDEHGPIAHYIESQKLVKREMLCTTILNLLVHAIMTVPMTIFAFNVHSRQSFLEHTIGAFEQETFAYGLTLGLAIGFPIGLVVITVAKHVIYLLYNNTFHPFYDLVKDYQKRKK